jgi:hypothetical protein
MVVNKEKIKMTEQNKAMLDSYLRNLLGVVLALITTAMASAGVASPLELGAGEWLGVLNGVWAAAVPTVLRYLNKKDPAFGKIAEVAAAEVSKKLSEASKPAAKAPAKPSTKKPGTGARGGGGPGPVAR